MEQRQEHVMSLFELYSCKLVFISILQDEAVRHLLTCPKAKFILIKPYFLFVVVRAAVSGRHLGKFLVRFSPSSANQHLRDFFFWELVFKMLINTHFIRIFGWEQVIRLKKYFVRLLWRKHLSRFLVVQIIWIPPRSWDTNPLFNRKSKPDFFETF